MAAIASGATITIGEQDYSLPKLTFKRIKRIWPVIQKLQEVDLLNMPADDMSAIMEQFGLFDDVLFIFSIALNDPEKTPEWIEENILAPELMGLQKSMTDLLIASGLAVRTEEGAIAGEAPPAVKAGETISMETGTASSQS